MCELPLEDIDIKDNLIILNSKFKNCKLSRGFYNVKLKFIDGSEFSLNLIFSIIT